MVTERDDEHKIPRKPAVFADIEAAQRALAEMSGHAHVIGVHTVGRLPAGYEFQMSVLPLSAEHHAHRIQGSFSLSADGLDKIADAAGLAFPGNLTRIESYDHGERKVGATATVGTVWVGLDGSTRTTTATAGWDRADELEKEFHVQIGKGANDPNAEALRVISAQTPSRVQRAETRARCRVICKALGLSRAGWSGPDFDVPWVCFKLVWAGDLNDEEYMRLCRARAFGATAGMFPAESQPGQEARPMLGPAESQRRLSPGDRTIDQEREASGEAPVPDRTAPTAPVEAPAAPTPPKAPEDDPPAPPGYIDAVVFDDLDANVQRVLLLTAATAAGTAVAGLQAKINDMSLGNLKRNYRRALATLADKAASE